MITIDLKYKINTKGRGLELASHFLEKVLSGFFKNPTQVPEPMLAKIEAPNYIGRVHPKIHQIMPKTKKAPDPGTQIVFVQFEDGIYTAKLDRVQEFKIKYTNGPNARVLIEFFIDKELIGVVRTLGGVIVQEDSAVRLFVRNEGYEVVSMFLQEYPASYTYSLIHWTRKAPAKKINDADSDV